jgi:alkylation response protein AidB-like acyl-CoA dehydrogenase
VDAALSAIDTSEEDIRQLRDALRGTLGRAEDDAPPTVDAGWRAGWPALAELGVAAFCVPEDRGGFGLQVEAAAATAQELGAALHGSPYAGLTASAHALAGVDDPTANEVLAGIVAGELVCTFGVLDPGGCVAHAVDGAPAADALVLADPGTDELLLLADRSAWTVDASRPSFDVSRTGGDVAVDRAACRRLAGRDLSGDRDLHRLLLAADALGGVQRMLDRTVAYAEQRVAFGKSIGAFQAVQHRLVDHAVRTRGMALLVSEASRLLAAGAPEAARTVALAGVSVSSNAAPILYDLVQLTGGIGFTWEYGLHYFLRRAHQDARLAANPRSAERTVVELEGWSA